MFNSASSKIKILVAPLNWGLGHASRCIPIIRYLLAQQIEVIVACGDDQKILLQSEFPSLKYLKLPGYDLKYGKNRASTLLKIIFQIPKILIEIKRENRWLSDFLANEPLDAVISDNRYGLYSREIVSVFITHQLHIKTPFGKPAEKIIQGINYRFINRFSLCWIPDFEKQPRLGGDLSHPVKLPVTPIRYIGSLSRFEKLNENMIDGSIVIILSGPEPQRTIFEKLLLSQAQSYSGEVVFVRGLPADKEKLPVNSNIRVYNHLPSSELNKIMCAAAFVICRSGYSSIMDIIKLGKKSIVIPTPGNQNRNILPAICSANKLFSA